MTYFALDFPLLSTLLIIVPNVIVTAVANYLNQNNVYFRKEIMHSFRSFVYVLKLANKTLAN